MRFMVILRSCPSTEGGHMPDERLLAEMGRFNEELVRAGVMLAGEGLHPSRKGLRMTIHEDDRRSFVDGPFAEAKELIAGFWIWQVKSKEEAIEWLRRCPRPHDGEAMLELRQVFEPEDFGEAFTPELQAQEASQRERIAAQTRG